MRCNSNNASLMKRFLILAVCVLLVGAGIFTHRIITAEPEPDIPEELQYRLNESLSNSISDLPTTQKMERYIINWMARYNIRGASLAIMKDEHLIYCKGFGWADEERNQAAEVGHIYRVASASKLITAVGVMKLCDEGKLRLDSKVFGEEGILKHITEIKDSRAKDITVRHLLNHTAGFSRRMGDPMFRIADVIKWEELDTTPTADQLIAYQLRQRLRDRPGGSAQYSNIGYLVLSRVIEVASGKNYERYLQENVLWPAGCYDMHIARNYYEERYPMEVKYYGNDPNDRIESFDGTGAMRPREYGGNDIRGLQGAGAWVSSAVEMLRLVASIDGKPGVPDILSPESVAEMSRITRKGDYALGWARYYENTQTLIRTGTMSGTCAYIEHKPSGISYAFLTNTSNYRGASFTNSLGRMIHTAMSRVTEWPTDRDLFVEVPRQTPAEEENSTTPQDVS